MHAHIMTLFDDNKSLYGDNIINFISIGPVSGSLRRKINSELYKCGKDFYRQSFYELLKKEFYP